MTHKLREEKWNRMMIWFFPLFPFLFSLSQSTWGCTVSVELAATSHGHHDGPTPSNSAPEWHCPPRVSGHCHGRRPEASLLPEQPRRVSRRLPQLPAGGLRGGGAVHRRGQGVQWVAPPLSAPPTPQFHVRVLAIALRSSRDKVIRRPQWNRSAKEPC